MPDLEDFLQAIGVACHLYNKNHLVWLRELATEINLEIIGENREGKPSSADLLTCDMSHDRHRHDQVWSQAQADLAIDFIIIARSGK